MATKRIYNMGTRATEFSKLIQSMTGKHQLWEIWADFVTMAACCISNSVDSGNRERREDLWEHFFRDCLLPWHEISENDMDGGDNIMNTNPECFTPEGIPSELADVIIRILDMCGKYGIDIGAMIAEKHEFNKTRPYKHGGKVI